MIKEIVDRVILVRNKFIFIFILIKCWDTFVDSFFMIEEIICHPAFVIDNIHYLYQVFYRFINASLHVILNIFFNCHQIIYWPITID